MKIFQFSVPILVKAESMEEANKLLVEHLENACTEDKETGRFVLKEKDNSFSYPEQVIIN